MLSLMKSRKLWKDMQGQKVLQLAPGEGQKVRPVPAISQDSSRLKYSACQGAILGVACPESHQSHTRYSHQKTLAFSVPTLSSR